jgi:uncharacterized protein (UPF0261 family)
MTAKDENQAAPPAKGRVAIIGALDTKAEEVVFARQELSKIGLPSLVIDSGILGVPETAADIDRSIVAEAGGVSLVKLVADRHSGRALASMGAGLRKLLSALVETGEVTAVLGIGGSRGTAMASDAMRSLPIGLPKIIVTPSLTGNLRHTVGSSDIVLVPTVADLLGVNLVTGPALQRAVRMLGAWLSVSIPVPRAGALVAVTSFGVTTPCVAEVRRLLGVQGLDVVVFPANGIGGPAMERLAQQGIVQGIIDITTHEVVDTLLGGACACPNTETRFRSATGGRIPRVVSFGATDFANFTTGFVPANLSDRQLYEHSPVTTLMRTNMAESEKVGAIIGRGLGTNDAPFVVVAPMQGFSEYDRPGGPFWDPAVDQACINAANDSISSDGTLVRKTLNINDSAFARCLVDEYTALLQRVA